MKGKQGYLSQFASDLFDSLQYDSTRVAPQYECNIFVTMATYLVPDLSDIKGFSDHLSVFHTDICQKCLIFMIQQAHRYMTCRSSMWPCLIFFIQNHINVQIRLEGTGEE